MTSETIENFQRRPTDDEYGEYFAAYVSKVRGENILGELQSQIDRFQTVFAAISEEQASALPPPFIWTIKQVVGHLIDGEKVFGYRLHRFACGDQQELPGFDHNPYVENLNYDRVTLEQLSIELAALRQSNLMFLTRLEAECWDRIGTANETKFTVRGLAYITAGHINHHLAIIEQRVDG